MVFQCSPHFCVVTAGHEQEIGGKLQCPPFIHVIFVTCTIETYIVKRLIKVAA